tara:strand:- start:242 stop:1549 length:1308 start_codon:yes stop_codon:yes gene_type:complete
MYILKYHARIRPGFLKILTVYLVIIGALSSTNLTNAQQQDLIRIAAIVNDEIISVFDLENRVRLVAATTNTSQSLEKLKRLKPQILRQMIDEKIQLQEAKKLNIRVSSREFNGTIANLERQSKMRPGQIWSFLRSNNIDRSALETQIQAKISWMKLVNRRIRRQISVGQEEINEEIVRLKNLKGKPQLHVLEIFLNVDRPDSEQQIRQIADRLISQILNGASFKALAREFSQSTTAARGGNLGWITESELDPELSAALSVMQPGQVSHPIRTLTGYYILFLINRRENSTDKDINLTVKYRQMIAPVLPGALLSEAEGQRQIAIEIASKAKSCDELLQLARSVGATEMELIHEVAASDLLSWQRTALLKNEIGKAGPPIRTPKGFLIIMPCERVQQEAGIPSAKVLEERLTRERLNLMSQKYLRDLRRSAYVDLRQ